MWALFYLALTPRCVSPDELMAIYRQCRVWAYSQDCEREGAPILRPKPTQKPRFEPKKEEKEKKKPFFDEDEEEEEEVEFASYRPTQQKRSCQQILSRCLDHEFSKVRGCLPKVPKA